MNSIIIEWSVLQLYPPSYSQNRSSLPKSVLAEFHGNSIRQCETVIGVPKNRLQLDMVDAAL